jgi:hypothetical protein
VDSDGRHRSQDTPALGTRRPVQQAARCRSKDLGGPGRAPHLQSTEDVRICILSYSAGVSPASELWGRYSL